MAAPQEYPACGTPSPSMNSAMHNLHSKDDEHVDDDCGEVSVADGGECVGGLLLEALGRRRIVVKRIGA